MSIALSVLGIPTLRDQTRPEPIRQGGGEPQRQSQVVPVQLQKPVEQAPRGLRCHRSAAGGGGGRGTQQRTERLPPVDERHDIVQERVLVIRFRPSQCASGVLDDPGRVPGTGKLGHATARNGSTVAHSEVHVSCDPVADDQRAEHPRQHLHLEPLRGEAGARELQFVRAGGLCHGQRRHACRPPIQQNGHVAWGGRYLDPAAGRAQPRIHQHQEQGEKQGESVDDGEIGAGWDAQEGAQAHAGSAFKVCDLVRRG